MIDHAERAKTIGASEVAALFGVHPYTSLYDLWVRKSGIEVIAETVHSERQQIGLDLERPLLEIWAKREGLNVSHNSMSISRGGLPGLSATPDGYVYENKLPPRQCIATVDIKTVRPHERANWRDNGIPEYYAWQLEQQMLVANVDHGYLVALFGVDEIAATRVEANPERQKQIIEATAVFWESVRTQTPPAIDDHKATTDALMRQQREEKSVVLVGDAVDWDAELRSIQSRALALSKEERALKNKILAAMGGAQIGLFADGSGYRVQTVQRKPYEVKAGSYQKFTRFKGGDAVEDWS